MYKRAMSLLLSLGLGCGVFFAVPNFVKAEEGSEAEPTTTEAVAGEFEESETQANEYTYHDYSTATPLNWNPHTWQSSDESAVLGYVTSDLVDAVPTDADNTSFKFEMIMATAYEDVTKEDFPNKEKYDIPEDAEGLVWKIELRDDLQFEDGTKIDANTVKESLKLLLDPARKNYRSDTFRNKQYRLKNADAYFNNDKAGQPIYVSVTPDEENEGKYKEGDGKLYVNLSEPDTFFGGNPSDFHENEKHKEKFTVDGEDLFEAYQEWTEVTDEVKEKLNKLAKNFGDENEQAYKEFASYIDGEYQEVPFEDVGFFTEGDHTLYFVLEESNAPFYMYTGFGFSGIIVHPERYTSLEEKKGDLVSTTYNSSLDTTVSYGAYKLVNFEKDKQMVYVRNDKWWGWNSEQFKDQYQATRVVVDVVQDHNTQKQLFLQGKLDNLALQSEEISQYASSDRLYLTDLTYTYRLIFATDLNSLKTLEDEVGSGNKRVLHYDSFRKGISLAIDRARFCQEATARYTPNYGLISRVYYYDIANDPESRYRNSEPAKQVIVDLYGLEYGEDKDYKTLDEAFEAINGYDVDEARTAFQQAYEEAVADGNYTDGQEIEIRATVTPSSTLTPDQVRQQDLLNEFVAEATVGTPFEGKVTFKFQGGSERRYEDVAAGRIECITGAWGGAAFWPFSMLGVYVSPSEMGGLEKIHESNGYDPTKDMMSYEADFAGNGTVEKLEMNMEEWHKYINNNKNPIFNNTELRLKVLAAMEGHLLGQYHMIPIGSATSANLLGKKVDYGYQNYNILTGFGGLRFMKFNYDDAAWADYVKSQGGSLNYE